MGKASKEKALKEKALQYRIQRVSDMADEALMTKALQRDFSLDEIRTACPGREDIHAQKVAYRFPGK